MNLRDYQTKGEDLILEAFKKYGSTLLVQATGTGKTVSFAHLIKTMGVRAMVLAHRNELIVQARNKIEAITGLGVEIEKAELYAATSLFHTKPVIVSSIQTQISGPKDKRRYLRFNPNDFGLLICDEAHHAAAGSWKEVIAHYRKNPNLKVLGVTATPDRADKLALGQVFESVAFEYGILAAIQDGWLVDITQQFVRVKSLDFSHVRTTAGDLNEGDLAKVMEMEENIQGICQPSLEVMFGLPPKTLSDIFPNEWRSYLHALGRKPRRTIIFTVSVAQAEACKNVFSRAIDGVEWVCGKTPMIDRVATLEKFATGKTHCVVNCGVLLEGFDNPGVEVIVMARPTKSRSLYCQAIGRSTRPLPGLVDAVETAEARRAAIAASSKPFCRILDFVGNSGKHKLISCADVLGGKMSEAAVEKAKAKALAEGKPVKILVTMSNAEAAIEKQRREMVDKARRDEEARKAHLLARSNFTSQDVNPFDAGHYFAGGNGQFTKSADGKTFSEKQIYWLHRAGIKDISKLRFKQGQAIIGKNFEKLKAQGWKPRKESVI